MTGNSLAGRVRVWAFLSQSGEVKYIFRCMLLGSKIPYYLVAVRRILFSPKRQEINEQMND